MIEVKIHCVLSDMALSIIYATVNGNTKRLATRTAAALKSRGVDAQLYDVRDIKEYKDLPVGDIAYFTSTHGSGQHPQSARPLIASFYQLLKERRSRSFFRHVFKLSKQPNLESNRRIAVVGIGSHNYPQFCAASVNAANVFRDSNIPALMDPIHLEVSEAEVGLQLWVEQLLSVLGKRALSDLPLANGVTMRQVTDKSIALSLKDISSSTLPGQIVANMYSVELLPRLGAIYRLHVPASLAEQLAPGAHIAIIPSIEERDIRSLLDLGIFILHGKPVEPDTQVQVTAPSGCEYPTDVVSVLDLLKDTLNLRSRVSYSLVTALAKFATSENDGFRFRYLVEDENLFNLLSFQWHTIQEFLTDFTSLRIDLEHFLEVCPTITPRLYSIASLPTPVNESRDMYVIDILVGDPKPREGYSLANSLCPLYLQRAAASDKRVRLNTQSNQPPAYLYNGVQTVFSGKIPLIGIALGSGLAPFRGYHELRTKIADTYGQKALSPYLLVLSMPYAEPQLLKELKTCVENGVMSLILCLTRESDTESNDWSASSKLSNFTSKYGTFLQVYKGRRMDKAVSAGAVPREFLNSLDPKNVHMYYCGPASGAVQAADKVLENILGQDTCRAMQDENRVIMEAY